MQIYIEGNIYIHIYVRENTNVEWNTHRSNAKTQPNIFPAKKIALSRIRKRLRKWETRRAKERERQRPQYIKVLVPRQLSEDTGGSRTAHSRSLSLSLVAAYSHEQNECCKPVYVFLWLWFCPGEESTIRIWGLFIFIIIHCCILNAEKGNLSFVFLYL